ncbi:MAG: hypothetical protein NC302_12780 [Bacteroidales bacterium]|nr:hypothetical protein [Bacteroidales bacterium]MCM1414951.1 hypothetical protein [bacterium]MCM1424797.1 hypothetical protein [bacterium]
MRHEMINFACAAVMLLLLIWRVRRGFACGMMREIANILSGAVALVCVMLIIFAIDSVRGKSMHVLAACVVALILLGIFFKIGSLVFRPLLAVEKISVVSGINKILGAVLGAAEAFLLAFLIIKALCYLGISVL